MRGRARRPVLIGLALVMVMGIAVYSRLWLIDYQISSDEAELLRRQFDLANREAMEESAEWRLRYDEEVKRASKCAEELIEIDKSLKKVEDATGITKKLEMLQKENMGLLVRIESLKQELEAEKLKCNARQI
ncbi:Rho-associated protein kinase [Actinidia chinensis var. chinensis]|uniref:Rho-associated protein kinase n=1 Tax=Actinidia chinensis var. chinensis TaxID=1590841 RepID=A0A2R6PKI8_ACTCC|nr:Rho-associated protein kinase [Actinidia chinensis var. chinensis]